MEENPLNHWLPSESLLRKFLLLLALLGLLYHASANAQSVAFGTGVGLETRLQSREVRIELIPTLQLSKRRHQLNLGPTVLLPFIDQDKLKINGLSLQYQYRLKPESWLNPKAGLQLIGQRTAESWVRNEWQENRYVNIKAANLEHYAASVLGLQINPLLHKNLHLSFGLAAGIYTASWTDISEQANTEFYKYAPYDESGLTYRARLGLSLTF